MKRRWGILIGLTLALATAATISAFTLTGGWGDNDDGPKPLPGEITQSDPADEERVSDVGSSQRPVTSIDDIDPDQCNRIHNITACEGEPKPSGGQGLVTSIDDVDPRPVQPVSQHNRMRGRAQALWWSAPRHQHRRHRPRPVQPGSQHQCV